MHIQVCVLKARLALTKIRQKPELVEVEQHGFQPQPRPTDQITVDVRAIAGVEVVVGVSLDLARDAKDEPLVARLEVKAVAPPGDFAGGQTAAGTGSGIFAETLPFEIDPAPWPGRRICGKRGR